MKGIRLVQVCAIEHYRVDVLSMMVIRGGGGGGGVCNEIIKFMYKLNRCVNNHRVFTPYMGFLVFERWPKYGHVFLNSQ